MAESKSFIQYLDQIVVALINIIAGLVIHSFIIGVNVIDWWKGRSVTPVDHIVTSLGISRMCTHCAAALYLFADAVFLSSRDSYVTMNIIGTVYALFMFVNVGLTSLLSVVLCLKISNFHSRLFLYLRGMIVHRTVYFIGATVLLSAANCFIPLFAITEDGTYNKTMATLSRDCSNILSIYNVAVGFFIPAIFYYISSVLLFTSLYHHTAKMKMSRNLSINLETYYSVMKSVFVNFIYNTIQNND
ncbi:hypothetical protein GDO78_017990 [Eleutherodactylus coqui]|uniref:Taste receptor type 2 member 40 n=1 Tax=Eleutherodactylus coqui TaxID=57060 RepID=A0A8J6B7R7_ELECQ|nr:hypothetical protein GDO78_017990 [Eleutherodactylus coqui]